MRVIMVQTSEIASSEWRKIQIGLDRISLRKKFIFKIPCVDVILAELNFNLSDCVINAISHAW